MEDWIRRKAHELAYIQYVIDFEKLTRETQERLLKEAGEEYVKMKEIDND